MLRGMYAWLEDIAWRMYCLPMHLVAKFQCWARQQRLLLYQ